MSRKRARPRPNGQRLPTGGAPAPGTPPVPPMQPNQQPQQPIQQQQPIPPQNPLQHPPARRKKRRRPIPKKTLTRSERQRRQNRRNMRRRVTRRLAFVLITLCMAFLAVTIFFRVDQVSITGTEHYTSKEIQQTLGIQKGDNLFTLRTRSLEQKLLNKYTYLSSVSITRKLPDTLVIKVKDSVPAAAIDVQGGGYFLMDANGKLLEQVSEIPEGTASVTGIVLSTGTPGKKLTQKDTDRANTLIAVTKALAAQKMTENVNFINVSALYDVRFAYQKRLDVRLGEAVQLKEKLQLLSRIINEELSPSDVNTVYLSDPTTAYCPPTTAEQIEQSALPIEDSVPLDKAEQQLQKEEQTTQKTTVS